MRLYAAATIALLIASTAEAATTRWIITDADQAKAVRIATEQAAQKAAAERSCYIPAQPRQCSFKSGLWSCWAENPGRAAQCGTSGRWKRAVSAR